jgi:NADH:ubiquinone oxidoreductase subunit E
MAGEDISPAGMPRSPRWISKRSSVPINREHVTSAAILQLLHESVKEIGGHIPLQTVQAIAYLRQLLVRNVLRSATYRHFIKSRKWSKNDATRSLSAGSPT